MAKQLDNPNRLPEIMKAIEEKPSLRRFYERAYTNYVRCLERCPGEGHIVELGSGAGFVKQFIPDMITSDILSYQGVDKVIDATHLPFEDETVRFICMVNVFHHISNVRLFLAEAERCLVPGGRLFMTDHHIGYISRFIVKYIHHEPYRPDAASWEFESSGPLSGANTALPWIVFVRDEKAFESGFPRLALARYTTHSPLWYWLSGGLKWWNLIPLWMFGPVRSVDDALLRLSPQFGSFADIEIIKTPVASP